MKYSLTTLFAFLAAACFAGENPLLFMENKGQLRDQNHNQRKDIDLYLGDGAVKVFIGDGQVHYQWMQTVATTKPASTLLLPGERPQPATINTYRMDMELVGANKEAIPEMLQRNAYYERYYKEYLDEQGVVAGSATKIVYRNIYPHIDWVLYCEKGQLKYDFVVQAGGDPGDIRIRYKGATDMQLRPDGSFAVATPMGEVVEAAPVSFQREGKAVASNFVFDGEVLSFDVKDYDGVLTIDPAIVWSTYYGGSFANYGGSIARHGATDLYLGGVTYSSTLIATTGAHQATLNDETDFFLVKFNVNGVRAWGTYYGSSYYEWGGNIATDVSGNIFIGGSSGNFIGLTPSLSTPGSHQDTTSLQFCGFLAKFDGTGARHWATYYCGDDGQTTGTGIATDQAGNVYYYGHTSSRAGIATPGAHQTSIDTNASDAFLVKFNTNGVRQWGTYYGGEGAEAATSVNSANLIAINELDEIYITGNTSSKSGIATPGVHQPSHANDQIYDGYVANFDVSGALKWGTYYGGEGEFDAVQAVATDSHRVYICGGTNSTKDIATPGSYMPATSLAPNGGYDGFFAVLTRNGMREWGSYFGGDSIDQVNTIAVNRLGDIYIGGVTRSDEMITTPGAFCDSCIGIKDYDAFLAKFDKNGNRQWSSYFGGQNDDEVLSMIAENNSLYFAGVTASSTGIATPGAHQTLAPQGNDQYLFITRFSDCAGQQLPPLSFSYAGLTTSANGSYQWYRNNEPIAGATGALYQPTIPGRYSVQVKDAAGCLTGSQYFEIWPLDVNDKTLHDGVKVYPTLLTGTELNIETGKDIGKLRICNVDGQVLYNNEAGLPAGANRLDVELLPGVYILYMQATDGTTLTQKLVRL